MLRAASVPVVLVVDDDTGLSYLIQQVLLRENWNVAVANCGAEALEWLAENAADLMLLDLELPDLKAGALIDQLNKVNRAVPFIVVTGHGDERAAVEMMKRGALDYLVKNVQLFELVPTVVQRAFERLSREERLAATEEALRRSEASLALAQRIAGLGSFEFDLPALDHPRWSLEALYILGLESGTPEFSSDEFFSRIVHPGDRFHVREEFRQAMVEGACFELDFRIVRPDGAVRHVHSFAQPMPHPGQRAVKVVGIIHDITERRLLENQILEIAEREQNRIGQDLHDGLCQHLAGIVFRLFVLKQDVEKITDQHSFGIDQLTGLVHQAIDQTRTVAHGLSPVMSEPDGLMNALHKLATATADNFGVLCLLDCPDPVSIHDNVMATHLYRIAQEAVHNAIRHGKAATISISLTMSDGRLSLRVKDDGLGLPAMPVQAPGIGLRVMHFRATLIGGGLTVQRLPEGGTSVACTIRVEDMERKGEIGGGAGNSRMEGMAISV